MSASTRSAAPSSLLREPALRHHIEADAFERLEARIAALASPDRTSDTILKRMGELAERVDQLTEQSKTPA